MNNEYLQDRAGFEIRIAQESGLTKFQLWKETEFQSEIEGLTFKEQRFFIQHTLLSLKSWYKKNVKYKALFDVINVPESELLKEWIVAVDFLISESGHIYNLTRELRAIPENPEFTKWSLKGHIEPKLDLYGYDAKFWEDREPTGYACWVIALSECYKVKFCIEYLENLLSNNLDSKRQEANTKKWALFYWFLMEANVMPEIRGAKKSLKELAQKHNLGEDNFYQTFNAVNRGKAKDPMKLDILKQVIPMLDEYPEARAKAELELKKYTKE